MMVDGRNHVCAGTGETGELREPQRGASAGKAEHPSQRGLNQHLGHGNTSSARRRCPPNRGNSMPPISLLGAPETRPRRLAAGGSPAVAAPGAAGWIAVCHWSFLRYCGSRERGRRPASPAPAPASASSGRPRSGEARRRPDALRPGAGRDDDAGSSHPPYDPQHLAEDVDVLYEA